MFCDKCGSILNENGTCPVCGAEAQETTVLEETPVVETTVEPAKDPGKVLGIVSLILGIVSLVVGALCSCITTGCGAPIFVIVSIVGIVLGALGMKKSKAAGFKNTLAMIGLIISIVATVIIGIWALVGIIVGGAGFIAGFTDGFNSTYNSGYYY